MRVQRPPAVRPTCELLRSDKGALAEAPLTRAAALAALREVVLPCCADEAVPELLPPLLPLVEPHAATLRSA